AAKGSEYGKEFRPEQVEKVCCLSASALYLLGRSSGRDVELLKTVTRVNQLKELEGAMNDPMKGKLIENFKNLGVQVLHLQTLCSFPDSCKKSVIIEGSEERIGILKVGLAELGDWMQWIRFNCNEDASKMPPLKV
ncbi:zinc finger family protein, partial [Corchorus olitorius]